MAMSWKDNGHTLDVQDLEYLSKIDWLWNHLSLSQKAKVGSSVTSNRLRQENSSHCIIGEAIRSAKTIETIYHENVLLDVFTCFVKTIFYDGPSYNYLLDRKVMKEEREILNDVYYAKIGNKEHQYKRANELVRLYVFCRLLPR